MRQGILVQLHVMKEVVVLHIFKAFSAYRPIQSEEGVTAIEYGLIAALIAVVIIGAVTLAGSNLSILFSRVATSI